jgi:uncharacterized protein (DUF1778 family)
MPRQPKLPEGPPVKRRKRQIPGKAATRRTFLIHLYDDEYELIRRAAVEAGQSMSGYIALAVVSRAKRDLNE